MFQYSSGEYSGRADWPVASAKRLRGPSAQVLPEVRTVIRGRGAGSFDSLFLSIGNSFLTGRIDVEIPAVMGSERPEFEEVPCIFLAYQGIGRGDEFALDSPHRH
jgi:hypothetical protein